MEVDGRRAGRLDRIHHSCGVDSVLGGQHPHAVPSMKSSLLVVERASACEHELVRTDEGRAGRREALRSFAEQGPQDHAVECSGWRRLRRVEVAVRVEPDQRHGSAAPARPPRAARSRGRPRSRRRSSRPRGGSRHRSELAHSYGCERGADAPRCRGSRPPTRARRRRSSPPKAGRPGSPRRRRSAAWRAETEPCHCGTTRNAAGSGPSLQGFDARRCPGRDGVRRAGVVAP